jgi:hypothetical protein
MRARSGGGAVVSGWRRSGIRFGGYERALMHYAILWAPYGGRPPDETLPIFGILSYELPERIREIALQDQARRVIVCGGEVPASALGIQRFDGFLPSRPDKVLRFRTEPVMRVCPASCACHWASVPGRTAGRLHRGLAAEKPGHGVHGSEF